MLAQSVSTPAIGSIRTRALPSALLRGCKAVARPVHVSRAVKDQDQVTGVIFEPFSEVKTELATVSKTDAGVESFARSNFHAECEAAVNEQINIEYNVSYVYHSMYAYFDRDNVALPGLAKLFKEASEEERGHAETLMEFQNRRGGRVKLRNIVLPEVEYGQDTEKGDALYAMELALSLEKLNFSKLRELEEVADKHNDANMSDFVEGMLAEQVESIKQYSEYVSQLRRVGKGLGVYQFDRQLQ